MAATENLYKKALKRRIRIRSIFLSLEDLVPFAVEPDLFQQEHLAADTKKWRFQETIDSIQNRYGVGVLMRGVVLAASGR